MLLVAPRPSKDNLELGSFSTRCGGLLFLCTWETLYDSCTHHLYIYIYLVISAGVMIFYPGTGNKNQRQGRNPKVNNKSAKLYHANSWCRNPGSLCNEQNYQQKVIIHFSQIHKNDAPFNLLVKGLKHL